MEDTMEAAMVMAMVGEAMVEELEALVEPQELIQVVQQ